MPDNTRKSLAPVPPLMPKEPKALELLRNMLNQRPRDNVSSIDGRYWDRDPLNAHDSTDLPSIPHPPMFRGDIPSNNPEVGRAIFVLSQIAPEIKGRVKQVWTSPTSDAMNTAYRSSYPVEALEHSNLLGVTRGVMNHPKPDHDIWVNPILMQPQHAKGPYTMEGTLAHEVGHRMGYEHGDDLDMIETLVNTLKFRGALPKRR